MAKSANGACFECRGARFGNVGTFVRGRADKEKGAKVGTLGREEEEGVGGESEFDFLGGKSEREEPEGGAVER